MLTVPNKMYYLRLYKLIIEKGSYLLVSEFTPHNSKNGKPIISRRNIKVGEYESYSFYELKPNDL